MARWHRVRSIKASAARLSIGIDCRSRRLTLPFPLSGEQRGRGGGRHEVQRGPQAVRAAAPEPER